MKTKFKALLILNTMTLLCLVYVFRNDITALFQDTVLTCEGYSVSDHGDNRSYHFRSGAIILPPDASVDMDYFMSEGSKESEAKTVNYTKVQAADLTSWRAKVPWKNSSLVPRTMSIDNYNKLMSLMAAVKETFDELKITWILSNGALLGSYICHDILPWDDDLDIHILDTDVHRLKTLQENGTFTKQYGMVIHFEVIRGLNKIYFADTPHIRDFPWGWPYIDFLPFTIVQKRVKLHDERSKTNRFDVTFDEFFPLHLRPMGSFWLPSPRNPWEIISQVYGKSSQQFSCSTNKYNHKNEKLRRVYPKAICWCLKDDYAFVYRQNLGKQTVENLVMNGTILYSVIVNETPIEETHNSFNWTFYKR